MNDNLRGIFSDFLLTNPGRTNAVRANAFNGLIDLHFFHYLCDWPLVNKIAMPCQLNALHRVIFFKNPETRKRYVLPPE